MSYRHLQVRLDEDIHVWFEENFPSWSKQGFVEECFRYLRIIVDSGSVPPPGVYAAHSVADVFRAGALPQPSDREEEGDGTSASSRGEVG